MRRMIVATGNMNKMKEIREILSDVDVKILSMKEAGISADINENGQSFAENAAIKALTVAKAAGEMAIADDSGLIVDCLDGEPGIHSARYMGEETSYDLKNRTLIDRVNDFCRGYEEARRAFLAGNKTCSGSGMPEREGAEFLDLSGRDLFPGSDESGAPGPLRSARFVCAAVVAWPDGRTRACVGKMEGRIAYRQAGRYGFGYDPVFFLPELSKTSAELLPEEKNAISHRGKAFREMHEFLAAHFAG